MQTFLTGQLFPYLWPVGMQDAYRSKFIFHTLVFKARGFIRIVLHVNFKTFLVQQLRGAWKETLQLYICNWHLIDCKVLQQIAFRFLPWKKENLTWNQESLRVFLHAPFQLVTEGCWFEHHFIFGRHIRFKWFYFWFYVLMINMHLFN